MKKVIIKLLIIFLLCIMIVVIYNQINLVKMNKNLDKSLQISNNYIDASFTSNNYIKLIKNSNNLQKYKSFSIEEFTNAYNPTCFTKIDQILYINLTHRKDRFKQINNEFKKMRFPQDKIQRIHAVNEKYNIMDILDAVKVTLKQWILF